MAERVSAAGGTLLDAPVSGGEVGAKSATLSIMVGGPAAALERVRAVLECMGSRIIHVGEAPGSGQLCKVCNQVAIGGALAGVSEALTLAMKSGVDPVKVREALLGGFAASKVLEVHGERLIKSNFAPGFRTRLYQKDLRLANEAAAAQGVAMPATAVVTQLINALVSSGGADLDYSALGTVLFDLAKLESKRS
jgi:2-hydroxy-3-oxopropionate reductase